MTDCSVKSSVIWHDRRAWWALVFGAWTLIGVLMASQDYIRNLRANNSIEWHRLLLLELPFAYMWALLTPVLVWFARRFPFERRRWLRSLFVHVFTSLLLSVITITGIHAFSLYLFASQSERHLVFRRLFQSVLIFFDYYILIYWLILMMTQAVDYYSRYREEELRSSQLQAQLAQAQLQALKMQLHPHFLFNTLHSIAALQRQDITAAGRMIVRLGDFLRLTLENSGAQEVSLQEELEFLKCYLEIERVRFQDRLTVSMEVEPQTLGALVPNLILQPIVENAIEHGIAPRAAPGRIDIRAKRSDGVLQMQVQDNGRGLGNDGCSGEGLGLANTRARLERLYGAFYRLELVNVPEGGLRVILEVPFKQ